MPYRKISNDIKMAAIKLHEHGRLDLEDILDCVNFSEITFWRTKRLYEDTGRVSPLPSTTRGRPRLLVRDDIDYLLELVKHHPSWLRDLLATNRFIRVHLTTIHPSERDQDVRADFLRRMAQYEPEQLGFLDEAAAPGEGVFVRGRRLSAEGLLTVNGMAASYVVEGSMTRDKYLAFLANTVVSSRSLVCSNASVFAFPGAAERPCHGQC
ncbi:hypothetical protein FA95DRAFT_1585215 [Auriscalpium vulgare]|uniref:Uncharacterized protein n=1 Tax=Auriscalpium vulgare TaxID=40419 RepID=A0ACB8R6D0_9AGAM|nr:hypothetical protein FA95DRAFT_1585215 [Auriscalpium vulgare]